MRKNDQLTRFAVSIIGILAGLGGASHGPGEILQGNIAPSSGYRTAGSAQRGVQGLH